MKTPVRVALLGWAIFGSLLCPNKVEASNSTNQLSSYKQMVMSYPYYFVQALLPTQKINPPVIGITLTGQDNTQIECIKKGSNLLLIQHHLQDDKQMHIDTLAVKKDAKYPLYIQIASNKEGLQFAIGKGEHALLAFGPTVSPDFLGGHHDYMCTATEVHTIGKAWILSMYPQEESVATAFRNQYTSHIDIVDLPRTVAQTLVYQESCSKDGFKSRVRTPRLYIFHPKHPKDIALIMCPGGGYFGLAMMHEGLDMGAWMNKQGITYAVLDYRLPEGNREVPIGDGHAAIRYMRDHAKAWGIDSKKIGIMGASAGGHLASTLATHYTDMTRPDFQVLLYPVITMGDMTHQGSRINLLGTHPSSALVDQYSNEKQVTQDTPPALIFYSDDDDLVPPINSINYDKALQAHGVSSEIHHFPTGGHGWGFRESFTYHKDLVEAFEKWIQAFIQKAP